MNVWKLQNGYTIHSLLNRAANAYLISAEGTNILVDTGSRKNVDRMIDRINRIKEPGRINYMVLTHTHYDHCLNAELLNEIFDPEVIVGESEEEYLYNGFTPLPDGTRPWSRFIVRIGRSLKESFFSYKGISSNITVASTYDIPGCAISVIPTPGHTSGSLSVIVNSEVAVVGDTLFRLFPKTIFPPFADNVPELINSWKILLETGCKSFLPAHGREIDTALLESEYRKYNTTFFTSGTKPD
ncbi:MAG TPA: MBL fold metallo-hydrolase [Bacteroidales bacterium]|nr:MBL fold metallo-hydrolase [Bacteroidales bacterium]